MRPMTTKTRRRLGALIVVLIAAVLAAVRADRLLLGRIHGGDAVFEVKPYLQLGDAPTTDRDGHERLALLWQTTDREAAWSVEIQGEPGTPWEPAAPPTPKRIDVDGVPAFRIYCATLTGLTPGAAFRYRVRRAGTPVFEAQGQARKPAGRPHTFVVFGDCATGGGEQNKVAFQAFRARPDYAVITGDVVYYRGRVSEYLDHFFATYNHDTASPATGAPLLRSTLFLAAPGNHDVIERDLDHFPDALAFFYYWTQPLNGPPSTSGAPSTPTLKGSSDRQRAFLQATAPSYPQMTNFSLNYGDIHWTILDSNTYVDWTDPALRSWVEADLATAQSSAWRIVAFHHPGFHASRTHAEDQRMRLLAPAFERGHVTLVLSGHVHNYQRSRPLQFVPGPPPAGSTGMPYGPSGEVDGTFMLDSSYDGATRTKPDGVIYVVTGAGGAKLYDPSQNDEPASWKPYTARFVSNVHSLTIAEVTSARLAIRQVSADGEELDRFVITR